MKSLVFVVLCACGSKSPAPSAPVENTSEAPPPRTTTPEPTAPTEFAASSLDTGFDLYVEPSGVTSWKLDGETRTDRLPSRIRGLSPGHHALEIDPPAGYLSAQQDIVVEASKSQTVRIQLQPAPGTRP